MNTSPEQYTSALRAAIQESADRLSGGTFDYRRARKVLEEIREFNGNWDRGLVFYVDRVEDWMEAIPAVWIMQLPFPHPVLKDSQEDWEDFLAAQRRLGGREAAYLTNSIRAENKHRQLIIVSRVWLLTAISYEGKVGSDDFWEEVLDWVVRELPDWTVSQSGDQLSPDAKTLRNMISVRRHKQFLQRVTRIKFSRDG